MTNQTLNLAKKVDQQKLIKISHIKRFYERWKADRDFREQLSIDSMQAMSRYNLKVDPEEVRPIWDIEFTTQHYEKFSIPTSVRMFQDVLSEGLKMAKSKHFVSSLSEPRFKVWRERQIARTAIMCYPGTHNSIVHAPICFELSKGCSVGCWFCGISAPRLSDIFTYNQENAKLWREVLELVRNILGHDTNEGFCYWATDPLDNPDYENFCSDFHEVMGIFPQTTTAQPLKNPDRTRALLKLSREKDCKFNRFSILSLKMLNQVHEEFSAEELESVKLVLQNQEAVLAKANVGRVREKNKIRADKSQNFSNSSPQETIACVTGFLFNMVDCSVKLISPCPADDRWPNGYIIYDEGTFSDIESLKILLEKMLTNNMHTSVRYSDIIRFRRGVKYERFPDGFQLSTRHLTRKFCKQSYLKELGDIIREGDKTAEEIILLFQKLGVPQVNTFYSLNLFFNKGVLEDEPQLNESKTNVKPEARPIP